MKIAGAEVRCLCFFHLTILVIGCQQSIHVDQSYDWWEQDSVARELSQLTDDEIEKFRNSELVYVKPVMLPYEQNVVEKNDYFDWPIATTVNETIILLYDRRTRHGIQAASEKEIEEYNNDQRGVRMVMHSKDGGETWSEPFDLFQYSRSPNTPEVREYLLGIYGMSDDTYL